MLPHSHSQTMDAAPPKSFRRLRQNARTPARRGSAGSPAKKCDGAEAWQAASECAAARTALESPLDLPEIRYAPSAFVDDGALHAVRGAGGGDGGGNGRRTSTDTSPLSSS